MRRGVRPRSHIAAVVLIGGVAGLAGLSTQTLLARASSPASANTAIVGGGFISVLAKSPNGTLIAGGDPQGLFRSVDGGTTWTPQDDGLVSAAYHVAALLNQGATWYAAVGNATTGGIVVSTDDGVTWSLANSVGAGSPPLFDGANLPGQQGHPRATDNLLATDGTYLYAASFGEGVQRWPLAGASLASGWQCVALCSSYLNSMALDGSGDAFVSVISNTGASDGVDELTGIAGQATTTAISASSGCRPASRNSSTSGHGCMPPARTASATGATIAGR